MANFNPKKREIECRLVYYGPGRSGKTSNLECIYENFQQYVTSDMISINTKGDRTLYFDFLPMDLGKIKGCDVRVQLMTVPGQVHYSTTRKLVLKGVDGIVFVADSLQVRRQKNITSLQDLQQNLKHYGLSIFRIPLVMQLNKRDLEEMEIPLMPVEQMEKELNSQLQAPCFLASAAAGKGVGSTIKKALELTLASLQSKFQWARQDNHRPSSVSQGSQKK